MMTFIKHSLGKN